MQLPDLKIKVFSGQLVGWIVSKSGKNVDLFKPISAIHFNFR